MKPYAIIMTIHRLMHIFKHAQDVEDGPLQGLISPMHMGCQLTPSNNPTDMPDIVFLYKLTHGTCPKSYGGHVAKLAGLPSHVVQRATELSTLFEKYCAQVEEDNIDNDGAHVVD